MRVNAFISQRELFRNKTKISFLIYKENYDTKLGELLINSWELKGQQQIYFSSVIIMVPSEVT